ncbi:glycoside hydrolase family 3 protein, partial [bacterium]|nr:glycoside hydrolase family 3 protein [bacterium]
RFFLTAFLAAVALLSLLSCAAPANKAGEQSLPVPVREILRQKLCVDLRYWTSDAIVSNESVTFTVKALDEEIAEALNALRPGAVILFAESCQDGPQVRKLTADIRAEARANGWYDPLLTVDEEGGRVERLTFGPHFPSAAALGGMDDAYIENMAGELADLTLASGFDLDFAPVCDIDSNPKNPVINTRSFGHDAQTVSKGAKAFIRSFRKHGLLSCAKHFPGHGDTAVDSHTGLPRVEKTLNDLRSLELKPFKAAIDEGVDCVMTSHIQFPNIETNTLTGLNGQKILRPATLSKTILKDVLRNELGFEGVIISDDMDMDAISKSFDWKEAVIESWIAGCDITMVTKRFQSLASLKEWDDLLDKAEAAVEDGRYPLGELIASYGRIKTLKDRCRENKEMVTLSSFSYCGPEKTPQEIDSLSKATITMKGDKSLLNDFVDYNGGWFQRNFWLAARKRMFQLFNGTKLCDDQKTVMIYNYSTPNPDQKEIERLQKLVKESKEKGQKVVILSCGSPVEEKLCPEADLIIETKGSLAGVTSLFIK